MDLAVPVHRCCSGPHFGELLHDEFVGVDDAKYGEMGTTASQDERRTTALFKHLFKLRGVVRRDSRHMVATNLLQNEKLPKRVCRLS